MLGDTGGSLAESALTGSGVGGSPVGLGKSLHGGATNLTKGSIANIGKSLHGGATTLPTNVKSVASKATNLAGADDRKNWSKLASTPGTSEFVNQRNRESLIPAIKTGQFQADSQNYIKAKMGMVTNSVKAKKLLQNYGVHYDETFGITNATDSISTKMQNFSLSDSKDAIKNSFSTLSSQVIESVSGKASDMFKDNILVNRSGQLFSVGSSLHGNIGNLKNVKSSIKSLTTNIQSLANNEIKGMVSQSNVDSVVSNVSKVTNIFKNVMAGQVTGIIQKTSLARKFGVGTGSENIGKSVHGAGTPLQGAFMSKISTITTKVGSSLSGAVSKFFG
jgi:hypothetical protein